MNTCLHSDEPTSLEKSVMLKWKMCACVCFRKVRQFGVPLHGSDHLQDQRTWSVSVCDIRVKHVLSGNTRRKRPADSNFNSNFIQNTDMTSVQLCVYI